MNREKSIKKYVLIAIATVVEHIGKQPLDETTTADLARDANINRKLLQEGFKEVTGMGIKEYRNDKRMEVAQQLLAGKQKSVKEIAAVCRYRSQSAFTTAFKKKYGISPTAWQEQQSKN